MAIDDDNGDFALRVGPGPPLLTLPSLFPLRGRGQELLPTQFLHVRNHVNDLVGNDNGSEHFAGLADRRGEVGALVARAALGENLADPLLRAVEPAQFGEPRAAGQEESDLIAVAEFVEDLSGGGDGRLLPRPLAVDHAHAAGVVQDDDDRRRGPAQQRPQAGHGRLGQSQGDQGQGGDADQQQQQVVDAFPPPRLLHADLQEAERGERRLDGLLPVDHVQRDRNAPASAASRNSGARNVIAGSASTGIARA